MLKSLSVTNYALIEKVEINFHQGFSVITGETGAGKSILLGALGLILGQRADAAVLRDKEQKCVVEAVFDITGYGLEALLAENEVEFEAMTVVRREILPAGKSRAFMNDTPVTLTILKDFTSRLIDIHSQHQTLLLGDDHFQLNVIDLVAGSDSLKAAYVAQFAQYRALVNQLHQLQENHQKQQSELDYFRFQHHQLVEAKLDRDEQALLEHRLQELTHSGEIKSNLAVSVNLFNNEGVSVLLGLRDIQHHLSKIASYLSNGSEMIQRIEVAYIDLKDLCEELERREANVEHDPDEIARVQQRLSMIYDLQQKHRVSTVGELLDIQNDLAGKINLITGFDEAIAELNLQIEASKKLLADKAASLSQLRQSVFEVIEKSLMLNLVELGMPSARFKVAHHLKSDFGADGNDDISFLFSANKSGELAELEKVASGGEMSRLMLCIKALISSAKGLPTLLLDEIDTGISGEIADKMGVIMASMAQGLQVISITHLPQIAGRGQWHYKVQKSDVGEQTTSNIILLSQEERVLEIAKMLSGSAMSEAALTNARELLRN